MISYGGAFVECSLQHPSEVEIVQLVFRINEVKYSFYFEYNSIVLTLFLKGCINQCLPR